jgi:hypothetical protein
VDAALHRIEALPGDGRYAVTYRRSDGSEQTAVVHLTDAGATVAEASLPTGWTRSTEAFVATVEALVAVERSRRASAPAEGVLRDRDGGWDVSLGNVVAGEGGAPSCISHGLMENPDGSTWICAECGAAALFG